MKHFLYRKALGEVIRELRTEKGWTLRNTASQSCIAIGYLSEIERGRKEISSELLNSLSTALGYGTYEIVLMAGYRLGGLDKAPDTASEITDIYETDLVG